MNLYLIGPMTGIESDNAEGFDHVQGELLEAGTRGVRTPFEVTGVSASFLANDDTLPWEGCMQASLRYILDHWDYWCEPPHFGIAMLDGWEDSRGAAIEHDLAASLGIPCKPWREWL